MRHEFRFCSFVLIYVLVVFHSVICFLLYSLFYFIFPISECIQKCRKHQFQSPADERIRLISLRNTLSHLLTFNPAVLHALLKIAYPDSYVLFIQDVGSTASCSYYLQTKNDFLFIVPLNFCSVIHLHWWPFSRCFSYHRYVLWVLTPPIPISWFPFGPKILNVSFVL